MYAKKRLLPIILTAALGAVSAQASDYQMGVHLQSATASMSTQWSADPATSDPKVDSTLGIALSVDRNLRDDLRLGAELSRAAWDKATLSSLLLTGDYLYPASEAIMLYGGLSIGVAHFDTDLTSDSTTGAVYGLRAGIEHPYRELTIRLGIDYRLSSLETKKEILGSQKAVTLDNTLHVGVGAIWGF